MVLELNVVPNLDVVPATLDLAGAEVELVPMFSRELRLRSAISLVENSTTIFLSIVRQAWYVDN